MCRLYYLMTSSANRTGPTVSTAFGRFPAHALRVGKSFATTWWRCVADVAWLRSGVASLRSSLSGISGTSPRCSRFWRSTVESVCACIQCASTVAWLRFVRPSEGYSIISNALDSYIKEKARHVLGTLGLYSCCLMIHLQVIVTKYCFLILFWVCAKRSWYYPI